LIIGDRALQAYNSFLYRYDLAELWKKMTGLPFVFALWVSVTPMSSQWIQEFNKRNALGLSHLEDIAGFYQQDYFDLVKYFREHISYHLTEEGVKGLNYFLHLLRSL
jgi:chorismate dehydratase